MSTLPEFTSPPEIYYNENESKKYHKNTRIAKIQAEITIRALQLLEIDDSAALILDLGCGSGLSGNVLSEEGYSWVGVDLSPSMLAISTETPNNCGLLCQDIGKPLPFIEESFDYAISISAVQWLFHSFEKSHVPIQRIRTFFRSLYSIIRKSAVIQFYASKKEIEILKKEALKAGFYGGLVTDNENRKNHKNYLVLNKFKPIKKRF